MQDFYDNKIKLNTAYFERQAEENILKGLSRDDLIKKYQKDCRLDCPIHTKKEVVIELILCFKYGDKQ